MATNTPNINLVKPAYTDNADIGVLNANSDKIDAAVKALQDLITALQTSTTPQAILNAIKTVDGTGSGLDADLLDGKDSTYFARSGFGNSGEVCRLVTDILNIKNEDGIYVNGKFMGQYLANAPNSNWYIMEQIVYNDTWVIVRALEFTDPNAKWIENRKTDGTWQGWKEIGGDNLFTVPRQFNVANAASGQTVFSYSGGAGEVNTLNFRNNQALIIIDGVTIDYPNFPYSGSSGIGWHMDIKIPFKNSVEIKTKNDINLHQVEGLVMTEK